MFRGVHLAQRGQIGAVEHNPKGKGNSFLSDYVADASKKSWQNDIIPV